MKKFFIVIFIMLAGVQMRAQDVLMRDVFIAMPDSFMPYLSHNNKLDLIDFMESGMASEVTNELDNKTQLDTLTADYLRLRLSPASLLEMKLLPYTNAAMSDSIDRVVCLVITFGEEPMESVIMFYTPQWKQVAIANPAQSLADELIIRPDTIDRERFDVLSSMISPRMVVCSLSPYDSMLRAQIAIPMLSAEERKSVEPLMRPKNLKWDGEKFK